MSPANRFHIFIATITIACMYWLLTQIPAWFPTTNALKTWQKATIAYVSSAAFYQLCATALRFVLDHSRLARRLTLGASYLEGTWIGCYKTPRGEKRLTVEHFEQTLDGLNIKGWAFTEHDTKPIIDWQAKAVAVDGAAGVLTYNYSCGSNNADFQGVANFSFERSHSKRPPEFINGYSADLTDGVRSRNREKCLSRKFVELPKAWERARNELNC